ncbi:metal ABC transporter ATP-binding protein [Candidatus Parcubacteria bacterium]|nr:MAG: metal ABC transporter ATP-binding protein [Candidatus Parcubacteria bacterium]
MLKPSPTINNIPAVDVEKLTVVRGNNIILKNVSFTVPQGSITAIIGPNGSGKTTLLKAILEIINIQKGKVLFFGKKLTTIRQDIGYVPQKFAFEKNFPITVYEFLNLARQNQPQKIIREKIKEVGLTPLILEKQLGALSGGQLQRVLIAQALFDDPKLLIMDEPSAGIDTVGEQIFYKIIEHLNKEHNTTIIIVSHDINFVANSVDQVICINKTVICNDTPKIALSDANLKKLFRDSKLTKHNH